jgi:hypothetical protein
MRKVFIFLFLFILASGVANANRRPIVIQNGGGVGNHSEHYAPLDMPEVYFDTDLLEIIIYADGYADYYDVDIISLSTMMAVISTQVDGYGDSIDISLIPDDNYRIVITSSNNNVYEGQFTNY